MQGQWEGDRMWVKGKGGEGRKIVECGRPLLHLTQITKPRPYCQGAGQSALNIQQSPKYSH